jgi:hypothetical protein
VAITDMVRKRSILLSARLRFSPATEPVRDTTVDKSSSRTCLERLDSPRNRTTASYQFRGWSARLCSRPSRDRNDVVLQGSRSRLRLRQMELSARKPGTVAQLASAEKGWGGAAWRLALHFRNCPSPASRSFYRPRTFFTWPIFF